MNMPADAEEPTIPTENPYEWNLRYLKILNKTTGTDKLFPKLSDADVESWAQILAANAYPNADSPEWHMDAVKELVGALELARRGECWCEVGIDSPVLQGRHSSFCDEIAHVLAKYTALGGRRNYGNKNV